MEMYAPMISMLAFALLLYFAISRPKRKQDERRLLMVACVKKGNIVYAGGGIRGSVVEVCPGSVVIETSRSKTRLEFDADSIESVDGFDYKKEKARQKTLRNQRMTRHK